MTSLNDIPVVGNIVNRIEDATVDAAILRLRYLLCYKGLVKVLRKEVDKLKIEEDAISRKAVAERDDGKIIKDHVLKWQQDVENVKTVVENLFERYEQRPSWMCFKDIPFAKPVSRFRLGKQAAENVKTVTELTDSGKEFHANEIAHHPPNDYVPISDTIYQGFQSRQEAYGKLWEALVSEDAHPILGIYGMPGVGKTRMMEEVWKEAREKGIFRKITRINVGSEKVDVIIKLQNQLAGYLDCHLESNDNEVKRALQLNQSLMNAGKTLVILDDVWDVISLHKIGIPFGDGRSKGCKILFTSRRRDLCLRNECKDPVEIKTLTEDESWHMFQNAVGTPKIESLEESLLAEKVCKKCGRLPLLINAVGKALKFMTENSWKDALHQLQNCSFEEIDGMEAGVYSCILLSFDKLTKAGKTCLLLCSLFPEDADINIQALSNLATGSPLLNSPHNIAGVVDILKSSSLLLQGKHYDTVKLHDTIRDVARSIAAKDPEYGFLSIRCRLGWLDNIDYPTRRLLHLDMEDDNVCFPNDLVYPDLHTLWLQSKLSYYGVCFQKLSSSFSEGLTNLRFLLQGTKFPEQKLSIHRLEKLIIIIIDGCHIDETFFSFVPQTLQTLCTNGCSLPSPLDLSKLKNLRKLTLVGKYGIKMVPHSMSSLSRLEELNIPSGFTILEDGDGNATSIYAELNKLTQLRKLTIWLPSSMCCLDGDIVSNLLEFNVLVGFDAYDPYHSLPIVLSAKSIRFKGNHIESAWMPLFVRAEQVHLQEVKGLFNDSKHTEAFANLKRLNISDCHDMDHLGRLQVNGRNRPRLAYFSNLCFLNISGCRGLTYLFPASVTNCLHKLQELKVYSCYSIEEIVRVDYGEVILCFPKLKVLHLLNLSSFKSFSTHNKVAFPSLEELHICSIGSAREIWGKGISNQEDSPSFSQLKVLKVERCYDLDNAIPVTLVNEFNILERVSIEYCHSLKTVFQLSSIGTDIEDLNQSDGRRIVFSSLKELYLQYSSNLKSFWSYDPETLKVNPKQPKVSLPNLEHFTVLDCKAGGLQEQIEVGIDDDSPSKLVLLKLNYFGQEAQFLPSQWLLQLQNLQTLVLCNCKWYGDSLFNTTTLTSNRLQSLEVSSCKMTGPALFKSSFFRTFQQLQKLKVSECDLLEEIVEDSGIDVEKTISLPRLDSLDLLYLPNLKSFSQSSSYSFNMPALTSVELCLCPLMDKFTSLPVNTPFVKGSSDLNSYVRDKIYGSNEIGWHSYYD